MGFWASAAVGASAGFAAGFISGAGNAWVSGAQFADGLAAGFIGGGISGLAGGLLGGIVGGIDAARNGRDFWDGNINEIGGDFGKNALFLDEEIPSGYKPTETGEIAKTNTNPNYGQYGNTRNGGAKPHFGVDYAGNEGDKVYAMYNGKVTQIGNSKAYGPHFVRTSSTINGQTYNVDYGHLSQHLVEAEQIVKVGDVIGYIGRLGNLSGSSFPTHVHIAVWRYIGEKQGFVMPSW